MSKLGSEKFSNNEYAPGIALYGIDGNDGKSGTNGNTLFVCQFDRTTKAGLSEFGNAVLHSLSMDIGKETRIPRPYINEDTVLFPDCTIWKIKDIDGLKTAAASEQITTEEQFMKYMELVGSVTVNSVDTGMSTSGNRLVLDTTNYMGFVINKSNMASNLLPTAPLSIISDDSGTADKISFLSLKSVYSGETQATMEIYYDKNTDAYHIDSDKPILIDADLQVTSGEAENYSEYSKIITSENSLTHFCALCNNITWTLEEFTRQETTVESTTIDVNVVKITINNNNTSDKDELDDTFIHVYGYSIFNPDRLRDCYGKFHGLNSTEVEIELEQGAHFDDYEWKVSIVGNIEVFIKKAE